VVDNRRRFKLLPEVVAAVVAVITLPRLLWTPALAKPALARGYRPKAHAVR
jgi:hypothetical protein